MGKEQTQKHPFVNSLCGNNGRIVVVFLKLCQRALRMKKEGRDMTVQKAPGRRRNLVVGGSYFIIDAGWENATPSYLEVEKNKAVMRKEGIMTFSDFKY